jgi:hypothetical protein
MAEEAVTPEEAFSNSFRKEMGFEIVEKADGTADARVEATGYAVGEGVIRAISNGLFRRGFRQAVTEMKTLLPADLRQAASFGLTGAEAASLLEELIPHVESRGIQMAARRLDAYEWLWMIRRLPLQYRWKPQGAVNLRSIMSCLALGQATQRAEIPPDGILKVTTRRAESVAFLMGFSDALSELMKALRWVGKGGMFKVDLQESQVGSEGSPELLASLVEYDRRVAETVDLGVWGLPFRDIMEAAEGGVASDGPLSLVMARRVAKWSSSEVAPDNRLERYMLTHSDLDEFFDLVGSVKGLMPEDLSEETPPLLVLSRALRLLIEKGHLNVSSALQTGYSVHSGSFRTRGDFGEAIQEGIRWVEERYSIPGIAGDKPSVLDRLAGMRPSTSPMKLGPFFFNGPNACVVDWHAASSRLFASLRFPSVSGEAGKAKGEAFEAIVQGAIAKTPCRPATWIEALVNRQLKRDRSVIGEFDAAATLPDSSIHFLVSCKSYPFSEAYERGEHRAVRNLDEKLSKDAFRIMELVLDLRDNPRGDNYEVPEGQALMPVLVVPRLIYTSWTGNQQPLADWAPPLLCSMGEFISYLRGFELES